MKKVVIIYDDTVQVPSRIKTIIGKNSYGDIILKRKNLYTRLKELIKENEVECEIIKIKDLEQINEKMLNKLEDKIVFHYFSNYPTNNQEEFINFLRKLKYMEENYQLVSLNKIAGLVFINENNDYKNFIENYKDNKKLEEFINFDKLNFNLFLDISVYKNLLYYISSGFDARYFNSLEGDNYTVTKKSKDKKKMKMEYSFYWLLPENMKSWMVMPYDYQETEEYGSYTMERLPMTDIAIRWTHGAIDIEEFNNIMDKTFYFFKIRNQKKVAKEEYKEIADKLYIEKVEQRIKDLKQLEEFKQIDALIKNGTPFSSIDEIIDKYKVLYNKITKKLYNGNNYNLVIGHGDVFFANMLYSKEINLLRLIDPKGALEEKDLWTNPYYDIAKLSHSVCGNYDFFNTDLYDINITKNMNLELKVHFNNEKYKEIFKKYLEENGYDYELVRLYESSLFLSMLPLHIDNPHKVLGFILNAINILEELEENV